MTAPGPGRGAPLRGLKVAEVSLGVSVVGAGLAGALPGSILRDLGADVVRIELDADLSLDTGVEFRRAWNRGKEVRRLDPSAATEAVRALAADCDAMVLSGPEEMCEGAGIGAAQLARLNPRLVTARIRPSFNSAGALPDLELLVAARAGVMTQIRAHTPGRPAFPDLAVGQAGAGLSATIGVLAGLYERESTGAGGWAETSLYDGIQAMLPMILGRVENHSPTTRLLWQQQGPAEALCYRCGDGGYIQLWFGAKGAYEGFLDHMGDPPSEKGYNADLMSGAMVERGQRWSARFATRPRDAWLDDLAGHDFRCEPALLPGQALADPHVSEIGLAVPHQDPDRGPMTVVGPAVAVTERPGPEAARREGGRLLEGVRVLDMSAYLAGPVAALVLAELGADVVKVEPVGGDVHRNMEPMFAAGQRGKRALALDLKSPHAVSVLDRLYRWSDVVHHNSRLGLAERLGYDEATVRSSNPGVVYSFASGFGESGRRAPLPTNDQLVQALAGIEQGQGGVGQAPTFLVWGAVDVAGGWLAACGILAGLYARRHRGAGQRVASNLLGAGLLLKSGAFLAGDQAVGGPRLDGNQNGYGACYRIYQSGDGGWLALAVPDREAWARLHKMAGGAGLPADPPPLRVDGGDAQPEEVALEAVFRSRPLAYWIDALRSAEVPFEPVATPDREGFAAGFVDDPVNRQLGRVVTYQWGGRGRVDQPCFPPRLGPDARPGAPAMVARLGQHTDEVLDEVGFDGADRARLEAEGAIAILRTP